MRRLLLLLLFALPALPQASNIPNTISIQASGAPSGACGNNFVYTNSATNDFYNCVAGAWNKVSAAGGTGNVTAAGTLTSHGVVLGAGGSAVGVTAAGTTGQVLTGVTGADPTFQSVTLPTGVGGPGMILLEEHTASSSAALNFTTCISATYDTYEITAVNMIPATSGQSPLLQMSTDGGSTYDTTSGHYQWQNVEIFTGLTGSTFPNGSNSDSSIHPTFGIGNSSSYGVSMDIKLFNPGSASVFKTFLINSTGEDSNHAGNLAVNLAGAAYLQTTAVNAFRFINASGNIASGTVRCYGVTK